MNDRERLEDALMRVVDRGAGRFGWHDIGVQLSMLNVPRQPDMLQTLRALVVRGFVVEEREGTRDRWALTDAGRYFLARGGHTRVGVPAEFRDLVEVLERDLVGRIEGLRGHVNKPAALAARLRRLVDLDLGPHDGIAFAASVMAEPERSELLVELSQSEHLPMRLALYRLWGATREVRPRQRPMHLSEARWDHVLRTGLMDAEPEIRSLAAGLAFDARRGEALCTELLANLSHRARSVRGVAMLALGSARDASSLAALRRVLSDDVPEDAAFALRALAARPDGRPDFWNAFDDKRAAVQEAAVGALRWVVDDLDEGKVAGLRARKDPAINDALKSYHMRQRAGVGPR